MRLLLVNSTRNWGGVKTWTLRVAGLLRERGHHVVVAGRKGDPFCQACRDSDVPVFEYPFGASWSPAAILSFLRLMRREQIQVVLANTGRDLSTAGTAAFLLRLPLVHRVGSVSDFRDTFVRRLVHRLFVSRMLTPAAWMIPVIARSFSWIRERDLRASPHSAHLLDHGPLCPEGRAPRLLMLGRLHVDKGQRDVLRACALLKKRGIAFHLKIAGAGPDEEPLQDLRTELSLEEAVLFCGFQQDVRPLLAEADLGLLYSTHEAISNVVVEYLCAGLAVVTSRLPAMDEVDSGSGCILQVPGADPKALAAGLEGLLLDTDKLRRQGALARQEAVSRFQPKCEAERVEHIFHELLAERDNS